MQSGYYRFPTICKDEVVFVCEDDLWSVPAQGGRAVRLTNNLGEVTRPFLSPKGDFLAFTGKEEGPSEVYCMPSQGGPARRLTYLGVICRVVGWSPDGKYILFSSDSSQPFSRIFELYRVSCEGGIAEPLRLGPASSIFYGSQNKAVLGRGVSDSAQWKRYRGGTAGVLWVDPKGDGTFQKLIDLKGCLNSPVWIQNRIYFISDHEGVGALYSCTPEGQDLKLHYRHSEFYLRNASSDGARIVFQAGGEIYLFDPASGKTTPVPIEFHSPQIQRQRKFTDAGRYLEDYFLHPQGHSVAITTRGKSFSMANWEHAVIQYGKAQGIRYRFTQWLDEKRMVTLSDEGGIETLEIYHSDGSNPTRLEGLDLGHAVDLKVCPKSCKVALSNHRFELLLIDLEKKEQVLVERSKYHRIGGFDWSPDGAWLTYSFAETQQTYSIKLYNLEEKKPYLITSPRFRDIRPAFDPEGKFIYFLSYRVFDPVYDSMYFDLNFPQGVKPYLVSLQKETPSPFIHQPKSLSGESGEKKKDEKEKEPEEIKVKVDLEGIQQRILAFPVPERKYLQILGVKNKVLFSSVPVEGALGISWFSENMEGRATLEYYDLDQKKTEVLARSITDFKVSKSGDLIYRSGSRLRVQTIAPLDATKTDSTPNRETGWLDLSRLRVCVEPQMEWAQMFDEIWRLQKNHFWSEDMCGIDWKKAYDRYKPLLSKITTRSEFSDLIWELQGELGTSHAYELGGDYRHPPQYRQGFLGADFVYDEAQGGYRITHVVQGDPWDERASSPLQRMGVNLQIGDVLLAINHQKLTQTFSLQEALLHRSGQEVSFTVLCKESKEKKTMVAKTLSNETPARYREWVESNRKKVDEATQGKVGYLHIPDMGPGGYAEFHRYYLAELGKEGLIVDVRYNGGGHVSQLILEKLSRKRIGYDVPRWGHPEPYPVDSLLGPMVALTNEQAGSDGDIFSHCFKLMNLGKLIGKRTWGGVIGIWPRHHLVDGSVTTQPEFSFWFVDVGWGVENYGTDPHIEVEIAPQDWREGRDPQLDRALEEILKSLKETPPKLPDFSQRPRLEIF